MRLHTVSRRTGISVRAACTLAFAASMLLTAGCADTYTLSPGHGEAIEIGALVSLSGSNSLAGLTHLAALEVALEDANAELADYGQAIRLSLGDTQSDPFAASVLMNTYLLREQRITVGPYTSAEVEAVEHMIAASQSLLISPSSTSLGLANSNDHIFRLAPNDSHMAHELVDYIIERGHRFLALIYRDDTWGNSVASEMERQFTAAGGTIISSHGYGSSEVAVVDSILKRVQQDIATQAADRPPAEIAVQLSSMREGAVFFAVANDSVPQLRDVHWYGSDGFVEDWSIFGENALAEFAAHVDFTSPIYRVDVPDRLWSVLQRIESRTGVAPGSYALFSYDALRVAARTLTRVGPYATYEALEATLVDVIAGYDGISGEIDLDVMGDRDDGEYDLYAVRGDGSHYEWVQVNTGRRRSIPESN